MNKIGVGLIGLGTISAAHLKSIEENKALKLIGVTDRNIDKIKETAAKYQCKPFKDNKSLIEDGEIQLVILLTPPGYHEELITACARNGKHIFAEKPIGTDMDKINTYLRLCKEKNIKLSVVSQHRFDSSAIFAKDQIDKGALGKLSVANCIVNWFREDDYYYSWHNTRNLSGGGVLAIQAIHTMDLMLWFMGEVESVKGFTGRIRTNEIGVEDTAMGCIQFVNGSMGAISATTCAYPGTPSKLDILGNEGSITIDGERISFYESKSDIKGIAPHEEGNEESSFLDPGMISAASLGAQYKDVIQSIRYDKEPLVSGKVASKVYEVIDAIYQSAISGQEIQFTKGNTNKPNSIVNS